jgi:hemerythrin-like domain-containing protein
MIILSIKKILTSDEVINMRTAGNVLSEEHVHILKVVGALQREHDKVERGAAIDEPFFYKAIDFIRSYADHFHHAKEEGILFRELNNKPTFPHGPVKVMLHEHEIGREYTRNMEAALKANDRKALLASAAGYAGLLAQHIHKENTILFPMSDQALEGKIQESMLKEFTEVEKKFTGIAGYLTMAKEFETRR